MHYFSQLAGCDVGGRAVYFVFGPRFCNQKSGFIGRPFYHFTGFNKDWYTIRLPHSIRSGFCAPEKKPLRPENRSPPGRWYVPYFSPSGHPTQLPALCRIVVRTCISGHRAPRRDIAVKNAI